MNNYIGQETAIEVDGTRYILSRIDRALGKKFTKWVQSITPNPFDLLPDLSKLPDKVAETLAKQAYEDAKKTLDITSDEVSAQFATLEGQEKLIALMLQAKQPHLTDEAASTIFQKALDKYGGEHLVKMFGEAIGELPMNEQEAEAAIYEEKGLIRPQKKTTRARTGLK